MTPPGPIDRVLGAIVPRAVGAVDIDEVVGQVDVDHLVSEVDVDAIVKRVDVNAVVQRVDIDALMGRVDINALLTKVDLNTLLANVDLNALLTDVDLNALLADVDLDPLLGRLDLDAVLAKVDLNAMMGRLDVDALMAKVDLDALLARVDIEALMHRAKIDEIVSNASRGVFVRLIDVVRRQLVGLDLLLVGTVTRLFRRPREEHTVTAGTVTGRIAGGISRLVAYLIDVGFISVAYGITAALVVFMLQLLTGNNVSLSDHAPLSLAAYAVFWFLYYWIGLSITGRSIGKGLVGLRVVAKNGDPISPWRAAVRTFVYPFSFILGLGLMPIVLGKRRRALHDWAAGDKVLYDWGDRPAEMPAPLTSFVQRRAGVDVLAADPIIVTPTEIDADSSDGAPNQNGHAARETPPEAATIDLTAEHQSRP